VLAVLAMLMGHITSAARGPVLGLCAGLVLFTFLSEDFRRLIKRQLLTLLLAGTSIIVLFSLLSGFDVFGYADMMMSKLETAIENPTYDPGIVFRLFVWGALFEVILAHPLLGVGFGAIPGALAEATTPYDVQAPHNLYLHMMAELGLVGLGVLLWIMVRLSKVIANSLRTISDKTFRILIIAFAAAILTKAVGGLTWGYLIQDRSLWLCLGLGLATINLANAEQLEPMHS
jgi:O-antigen ligase